VVTVALAAMVQITTMRLPAVAAVGKVALTLFEPSIWLPAELMSVGTACTGWLGRAGMRKENTLTAISQRYATLA